MDKEGYDADPEIWLGAAAGYALGSVVALGAFGQMSFGGSSGPDGSTASPDYVRRTYVLGLQAPLLVYDRWIRMAIAPRLGVAFGSESFGGRADTHAGVAYGGEFSLVGKSAHVGGAVGVLSAPTAPPGQAGRDNQMGSVWISFLVGLGG
jgi:hypothetical protein